MSDHPVSAPARSLTPEEFDQQVKAAHRVEQRIKTGLRAGVEALWEVAAGLYEFDEMAGWSALGYESLAHWLADPEVSMRKRTFYRLTGAYRETVVLREIPYEAVKHVDVSKLDVVLPAVKAGRKPMDEALSDAQEMGYRDLRQEYQGEPEPEPEPPAVPALAQPGAEEAQDSRRRENDPPPEHVDAEPAHNANTVGSGQVLLTVAEAADLLDGAREALRRDRRDRLILYVKKVEAALTAALDGGGP